VIQRADGAFLLAQRPAGKVYAGYWEFPGGKFEPGEPAARALARELHEELGIDVRRAYPWLTRVFAYPHATVRLNFFRVTEWDGEPHPKEDQAIAWQALAAPLAAPMLPANAPVLASSRFRWNTRSPMPRSSVRRRCWRGWSNAWSRLEAASGARARIGERGTAPVHAAGDRSGPSLRVQSASQVAVPGADGVHFPAAELMRLHERPKEGIAAASCHTREELERAMQLELDFAVLGPVKRTASHAAEPVLGWKGFATIARGASLPVTRSAAWRVQISKRLGAPARTAWR